ncbi:hypothetical protein FACS1894147_12480 [Spirochaetia bacterium]|nr:hypothetical protein FACS1894147_12480 [Spirochaetia bacterium]
MKRNRFFVQAALRAAGVLAMVLTFGLVLAGCASLAVVPETIVREEITLESEDVKALAAEWGYTEPKNFLDSKVYPGTSVYPQAKVVKFTATNEKEGVTRECIIIRSEVPIKGWQLRQKVTGSDGKVTYLSMYGWGQEYSTEAEANAAARKAKAETDALTAQTIVVEPFSRTEVFYWNGMKPLQ